jgi:hypothetical protein
MICRARPSDWRPCDAVWKRGSANVLRAIGSTAVRRRAYRTLRTSGGSTELEPESIEVAFLCDTYHHFEYPFKMLDSIHRALRPGGRLVIVDYKKEEDVSPKWVFGHVRADKGTVVQECKKAGFAFVDGVPDVMELHYVLRFVRR